MKILHLEDNSGDAMLVRAILEREFPGCAIDWVYDREAFVQGLASAATPDLVLSDFSLPGFGGMEALGIAKGLAPGVPFVFLSGSIGEERAIAAVAAGAHDYVLKDNMTRLAVVMRRAIDDFAQRRMREADERRLRELASIIERANEAIVVADMEGRITLWNDGAARLYGVTSADTVGRLSEEIFSHPELVHVRTAREATLETGEWQRELSITTRDGRDIVVDVRVTLVRDAAGNPQARLTIATDITDKRRLEEQFLRAQRVESLGLLAAGIAHDFNNVLAPIVMSVPLLRKRAADPGDIRVLEILEKSAARGAGLVRRILGFARGVGGEPQLTRLGEVVGDIGGVIEASFPKSIVLRRSVPDDLWAVNANATQINQVVLNLAVNARDAMMPGGGTLSILAENRVVDEAGARRIEGGRAGAYVVLEVSDTGAGIAPEVLSRIWDPFFTTKGESQGTGLGLSTVRGIVAAHGGFVTVQTRVGAGTAFRVFLPAAEPRRNVAAAAAAPGASRGQGELILVVDDETAVRELSAEILAAHGFRAVCCADGVEAVAVFKRRSAEILAVVSDVNMPNLDGVALARELRSVRPDVRILAITGLDASVSRKNPGVFAATLAKPFTAEALLAAVHSVLHFDRPGTQQNGS